MNFSLEFDRVDWLYATFWISLMLCAIGAIFSERLRMLTLHGKLLNGKSPEYSVPKIWFGHFYIFAAIALPFSRSLTFGIFLFWIHLFRRVCEQVFLFPGSNDSRMHIMAYVFGFVYYMMAILTVPDVPYSPTLFLFSNVTQYISHRALYLNRASKSELPDHFFFKFYTCPHYLSEMLIYISLISDFSSLTLALFVIISLSLNWRNQCICFLMKLIFTYTTLCSGVQLVFHKDRLCELVLFDLPLSPEKLGPENEIPPELSSGCVKRTTDIVSEKTEFTCKTKSGTKFATLKYFTFHSDMEQDEATICRKLMMRKIYIAALWLGNAKPVSLESMGAYDAVTTVAVEHNSLSNAFESELENSRIVVPGPDGELDTYFNDNHGTDQVGHYQGVSETESDVGDLIKFLGDDADQINHMKVEKKVARDTVFISCELPGSILKVHRFRPVGDMEDMYVPTNECLGMLNNNAQRLIETPRESFWRNWIPTWRT